MHTSTLQQPSNLHLYPWACNVVVGAALTSYQLCYIYIHIDRHKTKTLSGDGKQEPVKSGPNTVLRGGGIPWSCNV